MSRKLKKISQVKSNMAKDERRKLQRKAIKQTKTKNKNKHVRRKDWLNDWEDMDSMPDERIMPRGERERRRVVEKMIVAKPGQAVKNQQNKISPSKAKQGLVTEVGSGNCKVVIDDEILICSLRGALKAHETGYTNLVAVGDEVLVNAEEAVVESVLPRRSLLTRPDVSNSHLQQIVVANVDQVLIVASWREPDFWPELVDRYLIASMRNDLQAVICVNKVDLVEDQAKFQAALQPYKDLGQPIILTSCITRQGLDELQAQLKGRITVLAGLSGVGKSTLLSAVQPHIKLRTGAVGTSKKHRSMGRHTTSQASMLKLEGGGQVVDTPGIREFGLANIFKSELADYFPEMVVKAKNCKYGDCTHIHETECAVQQAVTAGEIHTSRYASYLDIYNSLPKQG